MSTGNLVPSKAPCPCNLKTNKLKHWQSLCDACDISYTCTTQHATLQHAYDAFNGWNSLVKGLSTLIECYVISTTARRTPWSSNCIGCDCNSSFGLRSCWKHVTSHSSVQKTSIHLGIFLASWNRQPLSSHQIPPILSTSSGIMSVCDQRCRTLHLPRECQGLTLGFGDFFKGFLIISQILGQMLYFIERKWSYQYY